jgi:DNA-binding NarL/FixJ family response regulator
MGRNQAFENIEVGIVETDEKRRQYKAALVSSSPGMHTLWSCATAKEGLESFFRHCPRVAVVSLFLSDMPGTELIRQMRLKWPQALPILLIPENQSRRAVEALEAGACGYLPSPCPADELIRGIRTVHAGGAILERPVVKTIVEHFRARGSVISRLTEREREVLICFSDGLSQPEVVAKFGISKETLHTHVRNVLGKLGARSTMQAVAFYLNPKTPAPTDARRVARKLENPRSIPVGNICLFPSPVGAPAAPLSPRSQPDRKLARRGT